MKLLQQMEDRGYPVEYLLTRIRGRRSRLISEWRPLIFEAAMAEYLASSRYQGIVRDRSPEGFWRNLLREYRWVYRQMNQDLRELFGPFFLYSELRTLFICLRHMKDKNTRAAGELLDVSLLSGEIKEVLNTSPDSASAVAAVERLFLSLSTEFAGLARKLEAEGLRSVEQKLINTYLAVMAGSALHPIIKTFFARVIDSRNIMSMYKHLRFEQKAVPAFIPGGTLPEARLREVIAREDLFGICSLVREFCGIKIDAPDPTKVEVALYKAITAFLKKEGKEPFGPGPILDYLWKCSLEVMNLNVLIRGKDLEREAISAELVQ
jgi:vacuolar-type H+-ATPase subunit C/Vma6